MYGKCGAGSVIRGPNNSIASKESDTGRDTEWSNQTIFVTEAFPMDNGKYQISLKVQVPPDVISGYGEEITFGVIQEDLLTKYHDSDELRNFALTQDVFGQVTGDGKLVEKDSYDEADGIIITMQLDVDSSTVKFWADTKPLELMVTGFSGPVRWCVQATYTGTSIQIVPTPLNLE